MYVKAHKSVDGGYPELETYTEITNLSFAPSADLAGASIPINEFQVDIHTTDAIELGDYAELYDDNDVLWAKYWIVYAEHIDTHTLRLRAQSEISLLDRVTLPARYFNDVSVKSVLDDTIVANSGSIGIVVQMDYTLDSSFDNELVLGFCPEQTARERLLWVCFTIGAYVKTSFNTKIEILPIDETETLIPMGNTYWKPTVKYNDWVTALRGKAYTFTQGTPQTTDTYVKDANGIYYIVTETEITLQNPLAPAAAPENIVTIEGVYLLNEDNVSNVLTHLSAWYFKRMEVDLDVINNASYIPGDRVQICVDSGSMAEGYIDSATFSFGLQSKAKIHLTAADDVEAANLIIEYMFGETQLDKKMYLLPVDYEYSITNPYIEMSMNQHRYVFRPLNEYATGTIEEGENIDTEECVVALDWQDRILEIISVDGVEIDDGVVDIE